MGMGAVRDLIAREALHPDLLSYFIDLKCGTLTLGYECEYWDYKRELVDLQDHEQIAELAADVAAFHNTRGGFIIYGITDEHVVLGVHRRSAKDIDSALLNAKLKRYVGESFRCTYASFDLSVAGTRKTFPVIFIPPRKDIAIRMACNAPGPKPLFKEGEIFIRAGDTRKRPVTTSDHLFVTTPPEPEMTVGSVRAWHPRPGFRIFVGDYYQKTGFIGEITRLPLIEKVIDQLLFEKWDVVVVRGVGGVGKTALAIEVTSRLESDPQYKDVFGGIISLSAKNQKLTPFALTSVTPEIGTYDELLYQILRNTTWAGDIPQETKEREQLAIKLLKDNNILLFIDNYETIDSKGSRIPNFINKLPAGVKTLITSKHVPISLPAFDVYMDPLDKVEARLLAIAEAQVQQLGAHVIESSIEDILVVSSCVPLAIKWIIGCSKNASHLKELIEAHQRRKPTIDNLCEFCFDFEFRLLSDAAKKALSVLPIFTRVPPSAKQIAVATDLEVQAAAAAMDELNGYSLVTKEYSPTRDEDVFRILRLTGEFAVQKLAEFPDLERQARRRLKDFYSVSVPVALDAAKEMVERGVTAAARQYIDEEILDRDPKNASAYFLKGRTYERDHQDTSALSEYNNAIGHAGSNMELLADASLRIAALLRSDPQKSREETLPLLERSYFATKDNRLAGEIARSYQVLGKPERSQHFYTLVYRNYAPAHQELWEEAVIFLCQRKRDLEGASNALDFLREAQRVFPAKTLSVWERSLLDDAGKSKWDRKSQRRIAPKS